MTIQEQIDEFVQENYPSYIEGNLYEWDEDRLILHGNHHWAVHFCQILRGAGFSVHHQETGLLL